MYNTYIYIYVYYIIHMYNTYIYIYYNIYIYNTYIYTYHRYTNMGSLKKVPVMQCFLFIVVSGRIAIITGYNPLS